MRITEEFKIRYLVAVDFTILVIIFAVICMSFYNEIPETSNLNLIGKIIASISLTLFLYFMGLVALLMGPMLGLLIAGMVKFGGFVAILLPLSILLTMNPDTNFFYNNLYWYIPVSFIYFLWSLFNSWIYKTIGDEYLVDKSDLFWCGLMPNKLVSLKK